MNNQSSHLLDLVFGEGSRGDTPAERALTSSKEFVRSQVQIAPADDGGTGRRLSAREALEAYGFDELSKIVYDGSAVLVSDREEPARTLRARREALNLTEADVAKAAGLRESDVISAEAAGRLNPIRKLEAIAQSLALDERVLGYEPSARGDHQLGVRLREVAQQRDAFKFSASSVLRLSESAWVIARQNELLKLLGRRQAEEHKVNLISTDYSFRAWQKGYDLAQRARKALGISPQEPIDSLRKLIEQQLGIPLVQECLDERFAGATIANGQVRGIVVNERGRNENVWVRRMTLAHELGHLLCDPDSRLNSLRADEYDGIEADLKSQKDVVEMRANGFAIAFLAPPEAMKKAAEEERDPALLLTRVISVFGVSRTAANYHLRNICHLDLSHVPSADVLVDNQEWLARENLAIDFFPIKQTPISRRGFFSFLIASAEEKNLISKETAATWLKCSVQDYDQGKSQILELAGDR